MIAMEGAYVADVLWTGKFLQAHKLSFKFFDMK